MNIGKNLNKIETNTVRGYKAVEGAFVGTYEKVENAFVNRFLRRYGESISDAKERMRKQSSVSSNKYTEYVKKHIYY